MSGLDYNNEAHRKIGAFHRYFVLEDFGDGTVLLGHYEYNCWGEKKGGMKKMRMDKASAQIHIKGSNTVSLALTKRGCCPPQLMKGFIMQEGAIVEKDPVEEAMRLHKRGYFGGGG